MRLYIVRHGKACAEAIDPARPLTPEGITQTRKIADFLKTHGHSVEAVFHSPKLRAQQTAEIFHKIINPAAAMTVKKYLSPEDDIKLIIKDIGKTEKNLMIVGHLPFVDRLVSFFIFGDESQLVAKFFESSVAVLERGAHQGWQLILFLTPGSLSDRGD